MSKNIFRIKPEDIKDLIPSMGYCLCSDKITIDGMQVGFMYRVEPDEESDSGWRFLSGTESQEYVDNYRNMMVFEVNTIANYDPTIIPYLNQDVGKEFERIEGTDKFVEYTE